MTVFIFESSLLVTPQRVCENTQFCGELPFVMSQSALLGGEGATGQIWSLQRPTLVLVVINLA